MVQFLISVIEWFAFFALSTFGIEYNPEADCPPVDAQAVEVVYFTEDFSAFTNNAKSLQDCAVQSMMMNYEDTPVLLQIPHRYDS